jgi:uncharacterized membrane protein YedE/YeeE
MAATVSTATVLWLAFAVAFALGAIAQKTHFCTMGAIADIVSMGDWNRMRMWLLAIGVAVIGAAVLHGGGLIDLGKSLYRTPNFTWLSYLIGGFCFGIGMVLASGCGAKTLIRVGGGSLKSLVVFLVLGLTAYTTMRGVLGAFRVNILEKMTVTLPGGQDLPTLIASAGIDPKLALWATALAIGGGLIAFAFASRNFLTSDNLLGGIGVGLAVVAAWYVSGHLGYLPEDPETLEEAFIATNSGRMEALSFVAPQAYTLELLMLWTDASRKLTFGIVTAVGVIAGSATWALLTRSFRWEGFRDAEDTARHLVGGVLMGFGGVTAMGCTIGQGISGISTLALGSILTFLAIIGGAGTTLKWEYQRLMRPS